MIKQSISVNMEPTSRQIPLEKTADSEKRLYNGVQPIIPTTMLVLSVAFMLLEQYHDVAPALAETCTFLFTSAAISALISISSLALLASFLSYRPKAFVQITTAISFSSFMIGVVCWYFSRTYTAISRYIMTIVVAFIASGIASMVWRWRPSKRNADNV
ncbi:hypothetical protein V8C42DRAFT_91376 [Trichoderma barbatum]